MGTERLFFFRVFRVFRGLKQIVLDKSVGVDLNPIRQRHGFFTGLKAS